MLIRYRVILSSIDFLNVGYEGELGYLNANRSLEHSVQVALNDPAHDGALLELVQLEVGPKHEIERHEHPLIEPGPFVVDEAVSQLVD